MKQKKTAEKRWWLELIIVLALVTVIVSGSIIMLFSAAKAAVVGAVATQVKNETRTVPGNATLNESTGGGYIYTYVFTAVEQNERWKAYVGNVTGTLTLDDANTYSIYEWTLGTVTGEVYATRNSTSPSWTTVNCTWTATGNGSFANYTNRSIEDRENTALSHTNLDNITATFSTRNHSAFSVGSLAIPQDTCYSIHTFVNGSAQTTTTFFPEVLLYDGRNMTSYSAGLIYVAIVENDKPGYNGNDAADNATYDFQMILPEVGLSQWASSTPYYFYVELT